MSVKSKSKIAVPSARLEAAGIPKKHFSATLRNYAGKAWGKRLVRWMKDDRYIQSGIGVTLYVERKQRVECVYAMSKALVARNVDAMAVNLLTLSQSHRNNRQLWDRASEAQVVLVPELAVPEDSLTKYVRGIMYEFFDSFVEKGGAVIAGTSVPLTTDGDLRDECIEVTLPGLDVLLSENTYLVTDQRAGDIEWEHEHDWNQ